jgi:hypothetical protein
MRAYVVFNRANAAGVGVIVKLHTKPLRKKVITLLSEERKNEAIDLIASKAEIESYIPAGKEPSIKPELTLIEEV